MSKKEYIPHNNLIKLIKKLKIDVRASPTPEEAGIMGVAKVWHQYIAVYVKGQNLIWLNLSKAHLYFKCLDSVLLHEIGHALIDREIKNLGTIPVRVEEHMANAIAIALHKEHNIPIHKEFSKAIGRLCRAKNKWPILDIRKLR